MVSNTSMCAEMEGRKGIEKEGRWERSRE